MNKKQELLPRNNFNKRIVDEAYENQEGCCAKCLKSISGGFERDHKDGNRSNNSKSNLQLLCHRCHDVVSGDPSKRNEYELKLGKAMDNAHALVEQAVKGEGVGVTLQQAARLNEQMIEYARELYNIIQSIPLEHYKGDNPTYKTDVVIPESQVFLRGFESGLKAGISLLKNVEEKEHDSISI